ncbi:stonustoxin subunit beta-like [Engraulis encrasicolus]|uniref:stonustoxin subunit beta-like n=1 Tax=Engraulis encrasicolus TaxID=184585 RepID=UPI002FD4B248
MNGVRQGWAISRAEGISIQRERSGTSLTLVRRPGQRARQNEAAETEREVWRPPCMEKVHDLAWNTGGLQAMEAGDGEGTETGLLHGAETGVGPAQTGGEPERLVKRRWLPLRRREGEPHRAPTESSGNVCACRNARGQFDVGHALIAEPVTREDFLQYSCHFTLDPNTAHEVLHLSEGNRRVECRPWAPQSYPDHPDHPDRFDSWCQVLCREGVSARCYWEVEWSGWVDITVSYKSISRKGLGSECRFGCNDQSWMLLLTSSRSTFYHNRKQTELPLVASSRIGVYVDHRAGTLAFYSISGDTMTLLHRVHTTFTHTLYPGFGIGIGSSVDHQ